ncbi:HPr-rel-A system PqqD family peptide chaperone [Janthinobacterium sp. 17J80-10]|uniref:HPr-rel-A system PqqD family peptide chaperone n=1 Tax=Janthinobacterium sp. 17J80-10 TaxID=2497863 RepID=UPI0013E8B6BD|nr:HPr-rel-A system PqqD family peptide chaperone [Janthinobacterium sp. 17J80-10]
MKWQVIDPAALHARTWDNEVVVYDAASGNTHLLDTVTARVLATVANTPADATVIAQALSQLWPEAPAELVHEQVDAMLAELAGISLITPVAP